MPTLRRTGAMLITAVLAGGVGTATLAAPAEAAAAGTTKVTAAKKASTEKRNKKIARKLVKRRGWSKAQFACLNKLWEWESNWNHRARNPYSGAYGIPQALPAGKMASAGEDWQTNPKTQIKWGLSYIKERYGTPCAAWGHSLRRGWY